MFSPLTHSAAKSINLPSLDAIVHPSHNICPTPSTPYPMPHLSAPGTWHSSNHLLHVGLQLERARAAQQGRLVPFQIHGPKCPQNLQAALRGASEKCPSPPAQAPSPRTSSYPPLAVFGRASRLLPVWWVPAGDRGSPVIPSLSEASPISWVFLRLLNILPCPQAGSNASFPTSPPPSSLWKANAQTELPVWLSPLPQHIPTWLLRPCCKATNANTTRSLCPRVRRPCGSHLLLPL